MVGGRPRHIDDGVELGEVWVPGEVDGEWKLGDGFRMVNGS